ncbi:peptidoglycan D,D-transpeptidase FtsI family protein [Alteribacillus iranensis]|uniref:serine-type D-Ala-D-Ala carboxypeptidase n=1 Tax=Alteribacillus iranensis TaxID=930128 RepID=A0A1I1ZEP2_9BACI|nr:penicillin-binding transpeptidase domain-containing protein [Alteribacillus iranensis]SFE29798.1 Cell division protein FtsI/penicillin-binding protein 2 [Alteribacillus iranensis]
MSQSKNGKNHIPFRLNVLFFAIFLLFSTLILRLGYIQIVQGDDFERDLEQTASEVTRVDAPRGLMYDRNGELLVDNKLTLSLTYTNKRDVSEEERVDIASKLATIIEVDKDELEKIPERNKKDFWLTTHPEEAKELITEADEEQAEDEDELYDLQLARITDEHLRDLNDELKTVYIWGEMISGYYNAPQRIKKGLTREEAHTISERLDKMPGVDILRDADRQYLYEDAFPRFFGQTGAIPRENLQEYLAKGYNRSDEVGTSFLEEYYESTLRGKKAEISSEEENTGEETNGSRGNDLVLTIDIDLQQDVESIIDQVVGGNTGSFINDPEAYAVVIEPDTGDILAVSGYSDHLGTVSSSFEMGSTVKAATVLVGLETGVVTPGTYIYDAPINLPYTPEISSVVNLGNVNYLTALERSSNVYMAHIAMRLAGYHYGSSQTWNTEKYHEAYEIMRYYYSQFGLGVKTGVDLPSESTGINGGKANPGNLLYLSFGQFDTYTPMQLAQYIATIANDGYRMQPRLVKEIHEPNTNKDAMGPVKKQFMPNVLNRIEIDPQYIDMVQQGLWRVTNGSRGTARSYFADTEYTSAGKTGTAQIKIRQESTNHLIDGNNQAFVGYAPYENPEVAVAVIVPGVYKSGQSGMANTIAKRALDAYFDLKEKRPGKEEETRLGQN